MQLFKKEKVTRFLRPSVVYIQYYSWEVVLAGRLFAAAAVCILFLGIINILLLLLLF